MKRILLVLVTCFIIDIASANNPSCLLLTTDNTWLTANSFTSGWEQPAFNDLSWRNALEGGLDGSLLNFNPPPRGIWDSIPGSPNIIYLRKTFSLNTSGTIIVDYAVDDDAVIYVNGTQVYSDADCSAGAHSGINITSFLNLTGSNTIAVMASDCGGGYTFALEMYSLGVQPTVPVINASALTTCGPEITTLSIASGNLNDATEWRWYLNACGGDYFGSGNSINVNSFGTTHYYVRGEGGCVLPGACADQTIVVMQQQIYYADNDNDGYGDANWFTYACSPSFFSTLIAGDCDDNNSAIHPTIEISNNSIDDNCNGLIDESGPCYPLINNPQNMNWCIGYVGLGDIQNHTYCEPSKYGIYTNLNTTIVAGSTQTINLDASSNPSLISVYIDFNGDSVFANDASELVVDNYLAPSSFPGGGFASFTVPLTATEGQHLMRVISDWGGGHVNEPCTTGYGEVEDYTITILPTPNWYADADADGYGDISASVIGIDQPAGYVSNSSDCNDNNFYINPGVYETAGNNTDDNCSGQIDEPDHCIPFISAPCSSSLITDVKLGTIHNITTCDGYTDYATSFSTTIIAGGTVHYQISSGNSEEEVGIYIDFNADGDFDDPDETVALSILLNSSNSFTADSFFVVPATQAAGSYYVRIISDASVYNSSPCFSNEGEAEDYKITVYPIPAYCHPVVTNVCTGGWISNITIGNMSNVGGCSGYPDAGYSDYSSTNIVSALAGTSIFYSVNTANGFNNMAVDIYIDYNNDKDFFDAGEHVVLAQQSFPDYLIYANGTFTIPSSLIAGIYRVRVIANTYGDENINPCTVVTGEVEDYSLIICPATSANIKLSGNALLIPNGDNTPVVDDNTDFGEVYIGASVTQSFLIENTGMEDLTGGGYETSGPAYDNFEIISGPSFPLPPGGSGILTIRFTPNTNGEKIAYINILTNDCDEPSYRFAIKGNALCPLINPEISVGLYEQTILNADITPDLTNYTISYAEAGSQGQFNYYIRNTGNAPLNINGTVVYGADAAAFSIITPPSSIIQPGDSSLIELRFSAVSSGTLNTTLFIYNDDCDEGNYFFAIQANIFCPFIAPEIIVTGNDISISDGDNHPDLEDLTEYAPVEIGSNVNHLFTIKNNGALDLHLSSVTIDGDNASDFSLSFSPQSVIPPGQETYVGVRYTSTVAGERNARLHIITDDCDESDFDFALKGNDGTYCTPVVNAPLTYMWISNVVFGTIDNSSGASPSGYTDYSNTHSTTAVAGDLIGFSVSGGGSNEQGISVYVDFNRDGDYDDPNENVIHNGEPPFIYALLDIYASGVFRVPYDQPGGDYRVRIVSDFAYYYNIYPDYIPSPCFSNYGEVEDYTLHITPRWYPDADTDGYGSYDNSILSDIAPPGYIAVSGDCDDNDASVHDGATAWWLDADNDQYVKLPVSVFACHAPNANYHNSILLGEDCDDTNPLANVSHKYYLDADHDGYIADAGNFYCYNPGTAYTLNYNMQDCNDNDATVFDPLTAWFIDNDQDHYSDLTSVIFTCNQPAAAYVHYALLGNDCDDNNPLINAGAAEILGNGIDDNCNLSIDENTYCIPPINISCNAWISNVHISDLNPSFDNLCAPNGYGDYSSLGATVSLGSLQTIAISISGADQYVSVYADYDNNNSLLDADELLVNNIFIPANTSASSTFIIPGNIPLGYHRIRIISSSSVITDPCVGIFGEVEDFSLAVGYYFPAAGLNFDGIDDYVALPNKILYAANYVDPLSLNGSSTLEAWIKPDQLPLNEAGIIARPGANDQTLYCLFLKSDGSIGARFNDGTTDYTVSSAAGLITTGTWTHISSTYDGSAIRVYVNETLVAQLNNVSFTLPFYQDSVYIGKEGTSADNGRHFSGIIDEVRLWSTALNQCQIRTAMYCAIQANSDLIAYYDFTRGKIGFNNAGLASVLNLAQNTFYNLTGDLHNFLLDGLISNWSEGYELHQFCDNNIAAMNVYGEAVPHYILGDGLSVSNSLYNNDFDQVAIDSSATRDFKIYSLGEVPLDISQIYLSGADASTFSIIAPPLSLISLGDSLSFTVRFAPSSLGIKNARVHIISNACAPADFDFIVSGIGSCSSQSAKALVKGNNIEIINGDNTPDFTDSTYLVQTYVDSSSYTTFTIENLQGLALHVSGITITGINAADFSISTMPVTSIPAGNSSIFILKFTPSLISYRNAVIHIFSDDCNHPEYLFSVRGIGDCSPAAADITVKGNNISIDDGASNAASADGSYFGTVALNASADHSFVIENSGAALLTISAINFSGINAADFTLISVMPSAIPAGGTASITVRYIPTVAGIEYAVIHILSNDCDERDFDFALGGTDGSPCIPVIAQPCRTGTISNFTMAAINNNSSCGVNGYSNYLSQSASASPGENVNFSLMISQNQFTVQNAFMFIDYNQNGNFGDPGEYITTSYQYAAGGIQFNTGNFVVPSGLAAGNYHVRVIVNGDQFNPVNPCYFSDGEAEDYTLSVTPSTLVTLELHLFIQGFYLSNNIMTPALSNAGMSNDISIVDNVIVELHDPLSPDDIIAISSGELKIDGKLLVDFPASLSGSDYYVVVKHRNSIETWSKIPVSLSANSTFDFTR